MAPDRDGLQFFAQAAIGADPFRNELIGLLAPSHRQLIP